MSSQLDRLLNTLESGEVTRYHAVPSVRPQNLAHHCWNVQCIIAYLVPANAEYAERYLDLMEEARLHDAAELYTGDIPYTVKRDNPEIKALLYRLEEQARSDNLQECFADLTSPNAAVLKLADTLDGFIWCAKYERLNGDVLPRWHEAYNIAREKFWERIRTSYGTETWIRADDLFIKFGGTVRHNPACVE